MDVEIGGDGVLLVKLSGGELILRETRDGLQVTAVDGRLVLRPDVANRVTIQVVET